VNRTGRKKNAGYNRLSIGTKKKVTVTLQPPVHSLGFLSPSLARRGEKPKMDFSLCIEYNLTDYYNNVSGKTRVFSEFSKQEYMI